MNFLTMWLRLCGAFWLTLLCLHCCTEFHLHVLAFLLWNLCANLFSYFLLSCLFNIFAFFFRHKLASFWNFCPDFATFSDFPFIFTDFFFCLLELCLPNSFHLRVAASSPRH